MIKKVVIGLMAIIIFLPGCKTFTKVEGSLEAPNDYQKVIGERLKENNFPKWLLIENADFELKGEDLGNAKVTIFVEKSRRIFLAVKYLGFEIARAEITSDSIKFINRLKKEYYFGNLNDLRNFMPFNFDFDLVQRFIYTGFYYNGERKKEFIKKFDVGNKKISYEEIFSEGQKVHFDYDSNTVKLDKVLISDYIHDVLAEISITRENNEPRMIFVNLFTGHDQKEIVVRLKDIKDKYYTKTDFKIGNNYTKLERLF